MSLFNSNKKVLPDENLGPKNLGDPNSIKLRKVEKDVIIPKMLREKARYEKCVDQVREFEECTKAHKYLNVFKCKLQAKQMYTCYEKWLKDPEFNEEVKKIFLEKRKQFRETSKKEKMRRF